eukprot:snap_masked-scaffold_61-processed-gene-0.57-mRNA-1 protein AED:1.00 eAED:1.00 QI:0/-1/0/0/-1/1/1/0/80
MAFAEHSTADTNRKPFVDLANVKSKRFIHTQQEKEEMVWIYVLDKTYFRLKEVIVEVSKRLSLETYDSHKPILLFADSSR